MTSRYCYWTHLCNPKGKVSLSSDGPLPLIRIIFLSPAHQNGPLYDKHLPSINHSIWTSDLDLTSYSEPKMGGWTCHLFAQNLLDFSISLKIEPKVPNVAHQVLCGPVDPS